MTDALSNIRTRNALTPQTEQADPRQVKNNNLGYVFTVSDVSRLKRFLTLGTDGGTFYQKEAALTKDNAQFIIDFAKRDGTLLAYTVKDISEAGRAPRQNPALFALAVVFAFGDDEARKLAGAVFNRVVRTGTHLFTFVAYLEQFRGWGRAAKRAVASWYESRDAGQLSYQMVKYRQREGWTHRDVLRSAHPQATDASKRALFDWTCGRDSTLPYWAAVYEAVQEVGRAAPGLDGKKSTRLYADIIRANPGLPWEALPDEALSIPETWEALLDAGLPMTALIRQLPRLTNLGLLTGSRLSKVTEQLTSEEHLRKARVHPVKLLYAMKTYALGHSVKGSSTWTPSQRVVDALDAAFYASFGTVEPAGKRTLLALDVSGSMSWSSDGIVSCAEGSAAMAMVTAATEPEYEVMGFASSFRKLNISPRRRLDDNVRSISGMAFGSTDCSLPMKWAADSKREFDTFVVYTDNETYAGRHGHPHELLRDYRRQTGIDAKLIVVGMTATRFTIADPSDTGMLDVAGFDSDTPSVISGFSRGDYS